MLFEPLTKDFISMIRDEIKKLKTKNRDSLSPSQKFRLKVVDFDKL